MYFVLKIKLVTDRGGGGGGGSCCQIRREKNFHCASVLLSMSNHITNDKLYYRKPKLCKPNQGRFHLQRIGYLKIIRI